MDQEIPAALSVLLENKQNKEECIPWGGMGPLAHGDDSGWCFFCLSVSQSGL